MAHVMTYEELCKVKKGKPVYEEIRAIKHRIHRLIFNGVDFTDEGKSFKVSWHYLCLCECDEENCPDYNWNYRVWNKMPTEKEMDNTPWKEDPYV